MTNASHCRAGVLRTARTKGHREERISRQTGNEIPSMKQEHVTPKQRAQNRERCAIDIDIDRDKQTERESNTNAPAHNNPAISTCRQLNSGVTLAF